MTQETVAASKKPPHSGETEVHDHETMIVALGSNLQRLDELRRLYWRCEIADPRGAVLPGDLIVALGKVMSKDEFLAMVHERQTIVVSAILNDAEELAIWERISAVRAELYEDVQKSLRIIRSVPEADRPVQLTALVVQVGWENRPSKRTELNHVQLREVTAEECQEVFLARMRGVRNILYTFSKTTIAENVRCSFRQSIPSTRVQIDEQIDRFPRQCRYLPVYFQELHPATVCVVRCSAELEASIQALASRYKDLLPCIDLARNGGTESKIIVELHRNARDSVDVMHERFQIYLLGTFMRYAPYRAAIAAVLVKLEQLVDSLPEALTEYLPNGRSKCVYQSKGFADYCGAAALIRASEQMEMAVKLLALLRDSRELQQAASQSMEAVDRHLVGLSQ